MHHAEAARLAFFPYCLLRLESGAYVIANRRYKPVGMTTAEWVDYEATSAPIQIAGLTAAVAAQLDCDGRSNLDRIYLYNDGCIPTASGPNWKAYSDKLRLLANLQVAALNN